MNASCTHPLLYVRDAHDACVVLEAVRKGILPLWTKRLSPAERNSVKPGNVYVWEEADEKGGLERWTDGRRWTQSRMRLDFLFYEELTPLTEEDKEVKRQLRNSAEASNSSPPSRRRERMLRSNGLAKQTISMLVNTGDAKLKRWHLVAYTSLDDKRAPLPLIDQYENLRCIQVPDRVFFTTRGYSWDKKPLNDKYAINVPDNMSMSSNGGSSSPLQATSSRSITQPLPSPPHLRRPSLPYRHSDQDTRMRTPAPLPRSLPEPLLSKPAMTRGESMDRRPQLMRLHPRIEAEPKVESYPSSSQDNGYVPLSPEDRRVLNSFNLRL